MSVMEFKMSVSKGQLEELVMGGMGESLKLKSIRVRNVGGKEIDFDELIFIIDQPIAVKK